MCFEEQPFRQTSFVRLPPPASHHPVFRRAGVPVSLFSEIAFSFFSKTLDLQVRFAHPSGTQGRQYSVVSLAPLYKGSCPRSGLRGCPSPHQPLPRKLLSSCARRPDRRQSAQPPLARKHLCRAPRPFPPYFGRETKRTSPCALKSSWFSFTRSSTPSAA